MLSAITTMKLSMNPITAIPMIMNSAALPG